MRHVSESARQTAVKREADVLVVGGGAAGIAAAVASARLGAKVLLVERYGFLGGIMTSVSLGSICGLYTVTEDEIVPVVHGVAGEIVERLRLLGGASAPKRWLKTASLPYDLFTMKVVADALVREAGIEVVLHSQVVDVVMVGSRIAGVILEDKSGRWAALGRCIIDCSGDADVAARAGCPVEMDLENLQYPTTMFRFSGIDTEQVLGISREDLRAYLEKAVEADMDLPRTAGGMYVPTPGVVHLNITRVANKGRAPDPLDPFELTQAEFAGREQVLLYQKAFREFVPGFKDCFVLDCGAQIGVRESRRVKGLYRLELEDVIQEARFPDAIACSAWPVEDHTGGRAVKWVWLQPGGYYQIPMRTLIPSGVDGLLVAGRCVSASHDAQASLRVAAVCMAMGQAAGVAAARAADSGRRLRDVPAATIQETLIAQGAFLGSLEKKKRFAAQGDRSDGEHGADAVARTPHAAVVPGAGSQ